jgi:hypothetical protein
VVILEVQWEIMRQIARKEEGHWEGHRPQENAALRNAERSAPFGASEVDRADRRNRHKDEDGCQQCVDDQEQSPEVAENVGANQEPNTSSHYFNELRAADVQESRQKGTAVARST